MSSKYVAPKYKLEGFTCPKCGSFSSQKWSQLYYKKNDIVSDLPDYEPKIKDTSSGYVGASTGYAITSIEPEKYYESFKNSDLSFSKCDLCKSFCLWEKDKRIYPTSNNAPLPNPDTPDDVKEDFLEARNVVEQSPRASAALLRLALQKLLKHLGGDGENINNDIKRLVDDEEGLPLKIQKSMDIVRVIGNEAVHPGTLDLKDDKETAMALFGMLNLIVQNRITRPKEIEDFYGKLPPEKLKGIKDRDKKK
jgi:hypothetical protein